VDTQTPAFNLTTEEKKYLLALARRTICEQLDLPTEPLATLNSPALETNCGAFVTLKIAGQLRGCIGFIEGIKPLAETVVEMAKAAAFRDPRFPPLKKNEIPSINLEISALSPIRPLADPEFIEVGRHGLIVEKGGQKGLLLPQVAVEYNWSRTEFLENTCGKAGLPPRAWQDPDTKISVFSAVVFGENDFTEE
jgi:AmmeMemoRadiSam system protein A